MAIPERLAISDEELRRYGPVRTMGERAAALLAQQRASWELARRGYAGLERVETRSFELDGFPFIVQHNPARITSSTANVDEASIRNRRCFLCTAHLPEGQKGMSIEDRWLLLVNPFPIFPEHFTVASTEHTVQQIAGNTGAMLRLIRDLGPGYTLFYNGPRSGASAPDHMHFQVGPMGFMPIDHALPELLAGRGRELSSGTAVRVFAVSGVLRPFFVLESHQETPLAEALELVVSVLPRSDDSDEEPMLNVIARWEDAWRVLVYPRVRHRPSFFFAQDPQKILISPAAVDMGGLSIAPRHEDFEKITREDLERMFREVCFDASAFASAVSNVRKGLDERLPG